MSDSVNVTNDKAYCRTKMKDSMDNSGNFIQWKIKYYFGM